MARKQVYGVCLSLLLAVLAGRGNAGINDGLVGHWPLTDNGGTVAVDQSGAGNNGTITGGPVWVADPIRQGTVLVFDGVDDRIDFGPLFTFRNVSWSISLWAKTPPNDNRVPLLGKTVANGGFSVGERDIEITGTGSWASIFNPPPAGNLGVNGYSMGGAVTNQSAIVLDDDTWHMVTVVHDNAGGDTDITLYIDGLPQPKGTATFNNNNQADTGNVYLGFANASGSGAEGYFVGRMSDLRLYQRAVTAAEVLQIMAASLVPQKAMDPVPADGVVGVSRDGVVLSWTAGRYAAQHDVYFGTVFADVNSATPASAVYRGRQNGTGLALGRLAFGTTYYWRVDEVNAPPDSTVFKGSVWSFTTELLAYPVDGKTIVATASSADTGQGPENTVNGSGLTGDLHSNVQTDMWLTAPGATGPAWIQYAFDRVLRLHSLWVWNQNGPLEPLIGLGAKEVTIEYSTDGTAFQTLGTTAQFARAAGKPGYAHDTVIDLGGITARYVKLTIKNNWGGLLPQTGLSEVRFYSTPVYARQPSPAVGATNVTVNPTLTWRSGREAASHRVYLGKDPNTLSLTGTGTAPSYAASLDLASTYYWRVDEVNDSRTPTTWSGDTWSFATQAYLAVEDFESYTDSMEAGEAIFQTWIDGYGTTTNGSVVGYANSPFAERTTVHGGNQSMPLAYDNTSATNSEARRTFASPQNWSLHGVKGLTLWFYGDPANAPQQMYVKINSTKILYDGETANLKLPLWQMWYLDLTKQSVSSVSSLSIGFDRVSAVGGKGKVLIDDIRLYPLGRQLITPVAPSATGLQVQYQFEGNAADSSGKGRNGSLKGAPTFVAGKIGQAISLNGTADYVNIDNYKGILADAAGVQQPFTVSAWIKTATNGRDIIAWGTNVAGQRMNFRVDTVLRMEHGNGNMRGTNGPSLINDEWHHVAATVPLGGTLPDTRLYVDGADVSAPASATAAYALKANIDVVVGQGGTQGSRFFLGLIDDVRIYDRVLSAAEIASLAGRTLPFDKSF